MKFFTPICGITLLAFTQTAVFAQDLTEVESASPAAARNPASQVPANDMSEYIIEITGYKSAAQFEALKEKVRAFLPVGSVSYEKSMRRGQVKFYVKTPLGSDDLLAQLNGVTLEQKNSILSSQAQFVEDSKQNIQMRLGQ